MHLAAVNFREKLSGPELITLSGDKLAHPRDVSAAIGDSPGDALARVEGGPLLEPEPHPGGDSLGGGLDEHIPELFALLLLELGGRR